MSTPMMLVVAVKKFGRSRVKFSFEHGGVVYVSTSIDRCVDRWIVHCENPQGQECHWLLPPGTLVHIIR